MGRPVFKVWARIRVERQDLEKEEFENIEGWNSEEDLGVATFDSQEQAESCAQMIVDHLADHVRDAMEDG